VAVAQARSRYNRPRGGARKRPITVLLLPAAGLVPGLLVARDPELASAWPASVIGTLLFAVPFVWYFYFKENVVLYYRQLGAASRKLH
jgi:hypothetical protein